MIKNGHSSCSREPQSREEDYDQSKDQIIVELQSGNHDMFFLTRVNKHIGLQNLLRDI